MGNNFPLRLQEKCLMQLPLTEPDTLFEELLQDLLPETMQMAREFKAFVRAKKVKTPAQLLRVVFLFGLYYAGACGALRPDDHGTVLVSLASGNRHKTLEECVRCRCVAGESQ